MYRVFLAEPQAKLKGPALTSAAVAPFKKSVIMNKVSKPTHLSSPLSHEHSFTASAAGTTP